MTKSLNELEKKLKELLDSDDYDIREFFDLGTEYGKYQNHISTLNSPVWLEFLKNQNYENELENVKGRIEKFLMYLVRQSFEKHLARENELTISDGHFDQFCDFVINEFSIKIKSSYTSNSNDKFTCEFDIVGELAKIFKKHNIQTDFYIFIDNENFDTYLTIDNLYYLDHSDTYHIELKTNTHNWTNKQYLDFLNEISAEYQFELLKNPSLF